MSKRGLRSGGRDGFTPGSSPGRLVLATVLHGDSESALLYDEENHQEAWMLVHGDVLEEVEE